jgi:hypothetical protein
MSSQPRDAAQILVPTSFGELLDKITILEIKAAIITAPDKLAHVHHELDLLGGVLASLGVTRDGPFASLTEALAKVNRQLWDIEDDIRDCERARDFGAKFVELARAVYITNDERARLKRELNAAFGSDLVEVKSYNPY